MELQKPIFDDFISIDEYISKKMEYEDKLEEYELQMKYKNIDLKIDSKIDSGTETDIIIPPKLLVYINDLEYNINYHKFLISFYKILFIAIILLNLYTDTFKYLLIIFMIHLLLSL